MDLTYRLQFIYKLAIKKTGRCFKIVGQNYKLQTLSLISIQNSFTMSKIILFKKLFSVEMYNLKIKMVFINLMNKICKM